MIKSLVPAAVAAIALGAPLAQAQTILAPQSQQTQPLTIPNPGNATNASATIVGQPQPGPNDYYDQTYATPVPAPYMPPMSPRTTWIPGHYNWDPNISNYVWTDGQYIEAPRENAQWVPGHWMRTETSWVWVDGSWR